VISVYPQTTNTDRLALLSSEDLPLYDTTETPRYYEIHDIRRSENALLLFNNKYVFKILQPYEDLRYSLKTVSNRQASLIEGLHWNRVFTQKIHLGLARYCDWKQARSEIGIGTIVVNPIQNKLDPNAEYVLVMRKLPKKYRLDCLLKDANTGSLQDYESKLTQFLLHIHTSSLFPVVSSQGEGEWGSINQLRNKLISNFETVEKPVVADQTILKTDQYKSLFSTCKALKETVLPIFDRGSYQKYFEERIEMQQIKRCHGDLKARNIWIMPEASSYSEFSGGVNVLDAIDFNPDYCNIDTLSDFAMLIADIYSRTNSQVIVNRMTTDYLKRTHQEDEASRFVLNYYLIEKAFVGAYVSILYDGSRKLGLAYLNTTRKYLVELKRLMTCK
jgi:aminoglycoside phosphotransferase family enzyme